ncbi:adenylate/guanylate cyclase domain-containing protein [Rhizobium sp. RAF56]|uniref:adenylate/guanylate cyclase domain-containing protein n=1 Tax=Rhizobium sp. RAF56 TaxID=3233062 RepID=UPI003F988A19
MTTPTAAREPFLLTFAGGLFEELTERKKNVFVLAGDLAGYSQLVHHNEEQGIRQLVASRGVFVHALTANGGVVVSTPGDFVLASFQTGGEALVAAIASQTAVAQSSLAKWKVGIAYGQVYEFEGDIYGHAVNVASRIQALAAPGEILLSDEVRAQLPQQFPIRVYSLGHHNLSKIKETVHIHSVQDHASADLLEFPISQNSNGLSVELKKSIAKPIIQLSVFEAYDRTRKVRFIASSLKDEIHLILARLAHSISVIDSSDPSKTRADYVLSGSVCGRGTHLRVMPKLVSTSDGATIWAERYDFDMRSSFDAQDLIAWEVVSALQIALTDGEQAQVWKRGTKSGVAWGYFQRGHDAERRFARESHLQARQMYEKALEIDPTYLCALVALAFCHLDEVRLGWTKDTSNSVLQAEALYLRAAAIDDSHSDVLALLGFLRYLQGDNTAARHAMERATKVAAHSPEIIAYHGALLDLLGDFPAAIRAYTRAVSLSHHVPPWIAANLALSTLAIDRPQAAELVCREILSTHPAYARAWLILAMALSRQDNLKEGGEAAARLLELDPNFSITEWSFSKPFTDEVLLSAFEEDMKKVGLPM